MTNALAHNQTSPATQDSTSTGTQARYNNRVLPGKKLPHAALSGCNQPHEAYNPVGFHQMAQQALVRYSSPLLIYRPRKDERLSWPSWLTVADGLPI